ncbi:unnamed protein product [Oppiella nova]|uniref:Uncharacterized protein n=1 Tax=Oppiella nova TaxID=334625 RepID=A0A7R9LCK6_9ACAR|nr:unnamed protein product [Oppiella nova]CAG2162246.1 unnamed protein product [Oppiella nova]
MPTDAVWVIITIPRKDYERELKKINIQNSKNNNNLNISNDLIDSVKKKNDLDSNMEKILSDALEELQIEDVVWVPTKNGNFFQVYFPCDLYENDAIMRFLQSKGIGTKSETSIGYIPFNLFFYEEFSDTEDEDTCDDNYDHSLPEETNNNKFNLHKKPINSFKEVTQNFLKSVTSRLTVAQVVEGVKSGSEVTFDFCAYTIFSGFIAAFGLINNDPVNIAASMMIEPIMGTVMAMTFGLVIEDRKLFMLGVKSNIISLILCLVSGFAMGLIIFIWMTEWNPPPDGIWPTGEMQGRGTYKGLIYGVMIALPCGGAIAVTLLNDNQAALVGVAVASTFLPPFINTGLLWALTTHLQIKGNRQPTLPYNISGQIVYTKLAYVPQTGYTPVYSHDMRIENTLLGCVSMALTALNIICMLVVAYIVLKIKEIVPLDKMAPGTQRFFKHDMRIARKYNRKSMAVGKDDPIGQQILEEWAEISGLDKNQMMNETPEARETRLQTLYDIAQDVESDETFQTVMSKAFGLGRRLTQSVLFEGMGPRNSVANTPFQVLTVGQEAPKAHTTGRRFTINPLHKPRASRANVLERLNDSSPYSTSGSGVPANEEERRRSSNLLRRSLRKSSHLPYSVWPTSQPNNRSNSVVNELGVRRRTIYAPKLEPHSESTGF